MTEGSMNYIKVVCDKEVAIFNWDNIICIDELYGVIDITARGGTKYQFNGKLEDIEKQLKKNIDR